ncbi:EAL domain-containing protein [Roseateles sp. BYS180W]|uniref:EAL domain-containing protein n=1 Tax=Roseateles rivi TaxID=3299028 RepID=A0ABW7FRY1_9BURK
MLTRYSLRSGPDLQPALRAAYLSVLPLHLVVTLLGLCLPWLAQQAPGLAGLAVQLQALWPLMLGVSVAVQLARSFNVDVSVVACMQLFVSLLWCGSLMYGVQSEAYRVLGIGLCGVLLPLLLVGTLAWLHHGVLRMEPSSMGVYSPALSRCIAYALPLLVCLLLVGVLLVGLGLGPLQQWLALGTVQPGQGALVEGAAALLRMLQLQLMGWLGWDGAALRSMDPALQPWMATLGGGTWLALALAQRPRTLPAAQNTLWCLGVVMALLQQPIAMVLMWPVFGQLRVLLPLLLLPTALLLVVWPLQALGWVSPAWAGHGSAPLLVSAGSGSALLLQLLWVGFCVQVFGWVLARGAAQGGAGQGPPLLTPDQVRPELEIESERRFVQQLHLERVRSRQVQQAVHLLNSGTLHMVYQLKRDARSNHVVGMEALLRLVLPDGEVVLPGKFLPTLTLAGMGDVFDLWVLRQVLEDQLCWRQRGLVLPVAVNLTASTLQEDAAFEQLLGMLEQFPDNRLELELLESSFIAQPEIVRARLQRLRAMGVRVYVDDFGTGHSNLRVFRVAAFDAIKLDRSLLDAAGAVRGAQLYKELCQALDSLGYELVAEGVETAAELEFVRGCGVNKVQGWWVGRPLSAQQVLEQFGEQRTL